MALLAAGLFADRAAADDLILSGSNRLEYNLARADGDETFEDLFRVDGWWRRFSLEARLRITQPTTGAVAESLDQRSFQYADDRIEIKAGTFYETWGRGLVLRAYETRTASVGRVQRSLSLDRDIDGVRVVGTHGPVRLKLLSGRPQVTPLSGQGGIEATGRRDRTRGGRLEVDAYPSVRLAASHLRVNGPSPSGGTLRDEFSSFELSAENQGVEGYLELAVREPNDEIFLDRGDALYTTLSYYRGSFGFLWEYKDYERFLSLYNEPPTLVKTHSWTLLNRQTHVNNPDDETGHQFEITWAPEPESGLTFNHARADNHEGNDDFRFRQVTLEGRHRIGNSGRARGIVDFSRDLLKNDDEKITGGGEVEWFVDSGNSLTLIVEWQRINRIFGATQIHRLAQVEFQRSPWLTFTLLGETSRTPIDGRNTWASGTLNVTWDGNHNLNLFVGRRPTGLLCTGGYCFFAPAFDGVELRLISRFSG